MVASINVFLSHIMSVRFRVKFYLFWKKFYTIIVPLTGHFTLKVSWNMLEAMPETLPRGHHESGLRWLKRHRSQISSCDQTQKEKEFSRSKSLNSLDQTSFSYSWRTSMAEIRPKYYVLVWMETGWGLYLIACFNVKEPI